MRQTLAAVIGLEIHAQINSKSKLFSGASTEYGSSPNSCVSYFDAALPGTLPVLNKYCVKAVVKTALAFGCHVNKVSTFDRKHYFYADMPAGYQITQYRKPIAVGGEIDYIIYVRGRHKKALFHKARLHQIQLEQDSGKSLHDAVNNRSLVDLNRAGIGLMEIVTKPDFTNGEQAAAFVREVQQTLRLINTCTGKMEQGALRVDANVSVHIPGEPYGVRTEVKNLNSLKAVQQAIDYEVERQKNLVLNGVKVENETMSFDTTNRCTVPMRDKERLQDYRFMAEPNLPPIVLQEGHSTSPHMLSIEEIRAQLPELRPLTVQRLLGYGLSAEHVGILMELGLHSTLIEMLSLSSSEPETVSKSMYGFLYDNVLKLAGDLKITEEDLLRKVLVKDLVELWSAVFSGQITLLSSRAAFKKCCKKRDKKSFSLLLNAVMTLSYNRIEPSDAIRGLQSYLHSVM
ncbi:GATB [Bugula neritina]|uniref:Glutamyl-tRNA(Gln) amidotransferase subunit B, mitochondrial n=1 Tax=Bugula neritina TaxID=10212 RepID=A0A7J7KRV4_BUGNE|nr:GATB [Bugula neritina]